MLKKNYGKEKASKSIANILIGIIKAQPCKDCGVKYPTECMDFDHLENKEFGIGDHSVKDIEKILAEIAKCEVVCANCHRIRTKKRRQ